MSTDPLMQESLSPLRRLWADIDTNAIREAIQTAQGRPMLWLEILLNDRFDCAPWQSEPEVQNAYRTACRWYTGYRRLVTFLGDRVPLPVDSRPIEDRDYRTFAEALSFVHAYRQSCYLAPKRSAKIPRSFFFERPWTSFARAFHLPNHSQRLRLCAAQGYGS